MLAVVENATETEIREIRVALQRIETYEYGECTVCHKPIAKSRLAAVPWATICIVCGTRAKRNHAENNVASGNYLAPNHSGRNEPRHIEHTSVKTKLR